jgi:hypothetical protein
MSGLPVFLIDESINFMSWRRIKKNLQPHAQRRQFSCPCDPSVTEEIRCAKPVVGVRQDFS